MQRTRGKNPDWIQPLDFFTKVSSFSADCWRIIGNHNLTIILDKIEAYCCNRVFASRASGLGKLTSNGKPVMGMRIYCETWPHADWLRPILPIVTTSICVLINVHTFILLINIENCTWWSFKFLGTAPTIYTFSDVTLSLSLQVFLSQTVVLTSRD